MMMLMPSGHYGRFAISDVVHNLLAYRESSKVMSWMMCLLLPGNREEQRRTGDIRWGIYVSISAEIRLTLLVRLLSTERSVRRETGHLSINTR